MSCPFENVPVATLAGVYRPESDDPHLHLKTPDGTEIMVRAETLLACLYALEVDHDVPRCPDDWWLQVIRRYPVPMLAVSKSLED